MSKRRFFLGTCILSISILTCSLLFAQNLEYPSGFDFVEVPDPLSGDNPTYPLIPRNVPVIGESFHDLQFGTVLTRVTQIDGTSGRHEYSRFDPFNVDQSMIALHLEGDYRVYRTQSLPYNQSSNAFITLSDLAEPRWDPTDPDLIWGLQDFSILIVNVQTGRTTVIKDFSQDPTIGPVITAEPDLYRITTRQEGEASRDRRFWAFLLQGVNEEYRARYLFTWDRLEDSVLGLYSIPLNESEIDWVGMSPNGNWVLIGGDSYNGGNLAGLTMANKELTRFHRLDYTTAHSDVGLDIQGNEVIVMQNVRTDYIDLIPIDWNTQPILEPGGSYDGTNRTPLIRLFYDSQSSIGLNSGVHISCNVPGHCVVSTFIEPGLAEQNWLDRTITLVKLDRANPRVFYLAKVYSTTGAYWEETHATITNDGSKVVWASNWNQNVGAEQVFLMQLDMPPNWMECQVSVHSDSSTYSRGDTMNIFADITCNAAVDIYLVLVDPDGRIISCIYPDEIDRNNQVVPFFVNVPLNGSWQDVPIFQFPFESEDTPGLYTVFLVFTRSGSDPFRFANWLAYSSMNITLN